MNILKRLLKMLFRSKKIEFEEELTNLCQTNYIPTILKDHCKSIINQLDINKIYYPSIVTDENSNICLIWMADDIYIELIYTLTGLKYFCKINEDQFSTDKKVDYNISNIPKQIIDIIQLKNQEKYNVYPTYQYDFQQYIGG